MHLQTLREVQLIGCYNEVWKTSLHPDEHEMVERYEEVLQGASPKGKLIMIYKLAPGDRLIFKAGDLNHGAIVPGGQSQCMMVFFDLELRWDTWSEFK